MSLLYLLERIRTPFLDTVMQFFTYFGEETLFLVLALTVFWCIDKREGYYLLFVGFFGTILNQFLKLYYRIPRPWVKDPDFTVVQSARAGATGYSFPSGHTQNVVGTLGGIARWHKHAVLRIVCIGIALLCAFSRMYLGVHTPLDVGVSLLIATVLVFVFYPLVRWATEEPKRMYVFLGVMVAVAAAYVCYANLADFPADMDVSNLNEGRKNGFSLLGALLGFCLAYPLERKYVRFEEKAVWWVQIIKVAGGLALLLGIKEGLKSALRAAGLNGLGWNAVRYFAVVLFAAAVWPLCFRLLQKLSPKERTA